MSHKSALHCWIDKETLEKAREYCREEQTGRVRHGALGRLVEEALKRHLTECKDDR